MLLLRDLPDDLSKCKFITLRGVVQPLRDWRVFSIVKSSMGNMHHWRGEEGGGREEGGGGRGEGEGRRGEGEGRKGEGRRGEGGGL